MLIRECTAADVQRLEHAYPTGAERRYVRAIKGQLAGDCTFLVAWDGAEPLGHGEVLWRGSRTIEIRAAYPQCPEINGLRVYGAELRGRRIGAALIRAAEDRARDKGFRRLGLGVSDDSPRATRLYARLGYTPGRRYTAAWTYQEEAGVERAVEDLRTFMTRVLTAGSPTDDRTSSKR